MQDFKPVMKEQPPLERAYVQRDSGLTNTFSDPLLGSLRDDPRWLPFVRKLGLATSPGASP